MGVAVLRAYNSTIIQYKGISLVAYIYTCTCIYYVQLLQLQCTSTCTCMGWTKAGKANFGGGQAHLGPTLATACVPGVMQWNTNIIALELLKCTHFPYSL